jgi:hypothetical protein
MKKTISATIDRELFDWILRLCEKKKEYRNKSHLIEMALERFRRGLR